MLVQSDDDVRAMVESLATHTIDRAGSPVAVIFEAVHDRAFGAVDSSQPSITLAACDWPTAARGDLVTVGATGYRVIGVEPDGAGLLTLRIELA